MSEEVKVTEEEFQSYVEVQNEGCWNMLSAEARIATGLDKETYMACIKNYSQLAEMYKEII